MRKEKGVSRSRLVSLALLAAMAAAALVRCARTAPEAPGREWAFPQIEFSLRLPEDWTVLDAFAIYARQARVPESEARALPLHEVLRKTRVLLLAQPPPTSGASARCALTVETEDLSRYPGVDSVQAYAELAEFAAQRGLSGYERLAEDAVLEVGRAPAVRRDCRALQPFEGRLQPVRSLTLFLKKEGTGIAVGAYELEERFEAQRGVFEGILASVRLGRAQPQGMWARMLHWLSGD